MTTQIISPSGQKNYAFGTYDTAQAYRQGDSIVYNGNIYAANDNIPANTPFAEGSTGATWSTKVIGLPASGLTEIVNGTSSVAVELDGNTVITVGATTYEISESSISVTASASPAPYLSGFSSVSTENLTVTGTSNLGQASNLTILGGTTGQFLSTDGLGLLSWADAGGQTTDSWITQVADRIGNPVYPTAPTFSGTTYQASTEVELSAAITASTTGDIIELTADITLATTLVIDKAVKITGGFIIQSAGTSSDPVNLISVTAAAYIDSTVTIKHRKTTNSTIEAAVIVNTTGFVSEATVEFMEFGYVLRGSFSIGGKTIYTGALGNSHRHIAIYNLSAPSLIENVEFDFPQEATARANLIVILSAGATDRYESMLKVSGCYHDLTKFCRQFLFIESLLVTSRNASLWVDNCNWDDLNGGIGMTDAAQSPLDLFTNIIIYKNNQGSAAEASYKGMMFIDGAGSVRTMGAPTFLAVADNNSPQTLRTDYSPAVLGVIAYKNTVYTLPTTFKISFGQFNTFGGTSGYAIGYRDIPQVSVAANATFALTDAGKHYYNTTAANFTLTVPNNSSVAFSTGSAITVVNQSANTLTIAQGTGVTMYMAGNATAANRTLGSYGMASLIKVGTDTWFINGAGVA